MNYENRAVDAVLNYCCDSPVMETMDFICVKNRCPE